jgi:hypothetical protein
MVEQVVVNVGDQYREGDSPPELVDIPLGGGAVHADSVYYICV